MQNMDEIIAGLVGLAMLASPLWFSLGRGRNRKKQFEVLLKEMRSILADGRRNGVSESANDRFFALAEKALLARGFYAEKRKQEIEDMSEEMSMLFATSPVFNTYYNSQEDA